jgi:hypothetical protein
MLRSQKAVEEQKDLARFSMLQSNSSRTKAEKLSKYELLQLISGGTTEKT